MDKSRNGVITTEELRKTYNVNSDPRYISGEDSKESIFQKFLGHFEEDSTKDGIVSKTTYFYMLSKLNLFIWIPGNKRRIFKLLCRYKCVHR